MLRQTEHHVRRGLHGAFDNPDRSAQRFLADVTLRNAIERLVASADHAVHRVDSFLACDLTSGVAAHPVRDDVQAELVVDHERILVQLPALSERRSVPHCDIATHPRSLCRPPSGARVPRLPPEFSGFTPDYMVWHEGRLYLLDSSSMRIAITESNGLFLKGYDLVALLKIEEKKRNQTEIGGFSLDRKGNILFTVPVMFTAYTLSPEGIIKGFGEPGSAPGKFGIVGGIVADDRGNYYVADQLKCVVSIFDKDFNFQKQFGYRGGGPQNLIGPKHLELDDNNMLYVSQLGKMGVSVFRITYNQP